MVETVKTRRKTGPRNVDWITVHDLWTEGHSAAWIARRFGLTTRYVADRCAWVDNHFPPAAPVRLKAGLIRRLEAALIALERGAPAEAERAAKALAAIVRAARALEEWSMDNTTAAEPADPKPEANAEDDPRAELERRIANLLDGELKRQAAAGGEADAGPVADAAENASDRGHAGGEPGAE